MHENFSWENLCACEVLCCQMERSCQFRRKWEGICNCNTSDIRLTVQKPLSGGVPLD